MLTLGRPAVLQSLPTAGCCCAAHCCCALRAVAAAAPINYRSCLKRLTWKGSTHLSATSGLQSRRPRQLAAGRSTVPREIERLRHTRAGDSGTKTNTCAVCYIELTLIFLIQHPRQTSKPAGLWSALFDFMSPQQC